MALLSCSPAPRWRQRARALAQGPPTLPPPMRPRPWQVARLRAAHAAHTPRPPPPPAARRCPAAPAPASPTARPRAGDAARAGAAPAQNRTALPAPPARPRPWVQLWLLPAATLVLPVLQERSSLCLPLLRKPPRLPLPPPQSQTLLPRRSRHRRLPTLSRRLPPSVRQLLRLLPLLSRPRRPLVPRSQPLLRRRALPLLPGRDLPGRAASERLQAARPLQQAVPLWYACADRGAPSCSPPACLLAVRPPFSTLFNPGLARAVRASHPAAHPLFVSLADQPANQPRCITVITRCTPASSLSPLLLRPPRPACAFASAF